MRTNLLQAGLSPLHLSLLVPLCMLLASVPVRGGDWSPAWLAESMTERLTTAGNDVARVEMSRAPTSALLRDPRTSARFPSPQLVFRGQDTPGYYMPEQSVPANLGDVSLGDLESASEEGGPEHIRDNAFLVEEAFNQEKGEVQHIFNWIHLWDWPGASKTRDFAATYTMELPLGGQKHQFSFTTQFLTAFEYPSGGPATQQADVGDTFLNYRYQLLDNDEFLWCAPRMTLIVPTADRRFGLGTGQVGYQFNLPISRYGENFDFHFNLGGTIVPDVALTLPNGLPSAPQALRGYNVGASVFWKPEVYLNFFVEWLLLSNEELDGLASIQNSTDSFLNPGLRYAVCQFDEVEWVIGASVPIGLTENSPDIGLFVYMSVEHLFRKPD